ncbi:hypothetical protein KAH81_10175 [bacterium]|nr:hypothetical protein [bacterium]
MFLTLKYIQLSFSCNYVSIAELERVELVRLSATILMIFLTAYSSFASEIKTNVISVVDGSTVIIDTETGHRTIRIAGYESPRTGQLCFVEAKELLKKIINNKPVLIKYLRGHNDIANLTPASGKSIPIVFVATGLGRITKASSKTLKNLQEKAKLEKKGLWKNYNLLNDFKIRKKNKSPKTRTITTQNSRSSLYGDSVTDILRDRDGSAIGKGGGFVIANEGMHRSSSESISTRSISRGGRDNSTKAIDLVVLTGYFDNNKLKIDFHYKNTSIDELVFWRSGSVGTVCEVYKNIGDILDPLRGELITTIRKTVNSCHQSIYVDIPYQYVNTGNFDIVECVVDTGWKKMTAFDTYRFNSY